MADKTLTALLVAVSSRRLLFLRQSDDMPSPREPDPIFDARRALGRQLAALRQSAGYSQAGFAPLTGYTRSTLGNVETGRQNVPRQFWERCRDALGAPELVAGYEQVEKMLMADKRAAAFRAQADRETKMRAWRQSGGLRPVATQVSGMIQALWPGVQQSLQLPGHGADCHLELPLGRLLKHSGHVAIQVHAVTKSREGTLVIPSADPRLRQFSTTTQRAMVVGVDGQAGTPRLHAVDVRYVRSELRQASGKLPVINVHEEYELDDLSYAIVWAVATLDDALLSDDYALDERQRELSAYQEILDSAISRGDTRDLTEASRLWLGSAFCARHILGHLRQVGELPVFWTQEQTGEEACMWLLFRHKHEYLRQISRWCDGSGGHQLTRGFCIPETTALASPRWERILFFLAAALMESMGIRVMICAEPGYAEADGFVLVPGSHAIIATWIHAKGIWHAGVSSSPSVLREFGDITGYADAHSVTNAPSPGRRLTVLADYLGLDRAWLGTRCRQLAQAGCGRLVQPRSRLLSIDGVDTALRFAGNTSRDEVSC